MTRAEQARTAATDIDPPADLLTIAIRAADRMDYCTTTPHTIEQVCGLVVEAAGKEAAEAAAAREREPAPIHRDPTFAGANEPGVPEEARRIESCAETLVDLVLSIDRLSQQFSTGTTPMVLPPLRPRSKDAPRDRSDRLEAAAVRLRALAPHLGILVVMAPPDEMGLAWMMRQVDEMARWLQQKCFDHHAAHKGALTAEPKPRLECVVCASHDVHDVDVDQGLRCVRCRKFIDVNDCWPSAAICREWDRHPVRPRITPAMVSEAVRAGVGKPKRRGKRASCAPDASRIEGA